MRRRWSQKTFFAIALVLTVVLALILASRHESQDNLGWVRKYGGTESVKRLVLDGRWYATRYQFKFDRISVALMSELRARSYVMVDDKDASVGGILKNGNTFVVNRAENILLINVNRPKD
jgi:hypothetical protein